VGFSHILGNVLGIYRPISRLQVRQLGGRASSPPVNHPFGWPLPVARRARLPKLPGNRTVACAFPGKTGNPVTKRRRNMPSHTLRRRRRPELQANRKRELSREAAIAAQLRALIPCSTDPAWLKAIAQELEARGVRTPAGRSDLGAGAGLAPAGGLDPAASS
jgi:hypothetical protein